MIEVKLLQPMKINGEPYPAGSEVEVTEWMAKKMQQEGYVSPDMHIQVTRLDKRTARKAFKT